MSSSLAAIYNSTLLRTVLLLSFAQCTGILQKPSSTTKEDFKVESSKSVYSASDIELVYENAPKNIKSYCILENNTDKNDCFWIDGNLPKKYSSETGDGIKVLTIWTINKRNTTSEPYSTNAFVVDTTAPTWTNANLLHASSYSSLFLSPSITFDANATDELTEIRYQYAIGTSNGVANRANIKNWTDIDATTSFQSDGLNLVDGTLYYVSLRAVDAANNVSKVHTTTGWTVTMTTPDPSFVSISPNSPSNDSNPEIVGTVGTAAVTVNLFSDASCSTQIGTGSRGTFVGPGISLSMPLNPATPTTIYAQSVDGSSGLSNCVFMTNYKHDNVAPTVARVYSNTAAGNYASGAVIDIRVEFMENITVVGTPQLTLETGTTDATLNLASVLSSNTLLFSYVVANGHFSSDLNYTSTSALTAGTSIRDAAGNNVSLTLPGLAAVESLAGQEALVIDGVVPAAPSIVLSSPASSPGTDSTPTFTIELTGGVNFLASDIITLHEGADCSAAAVATLTSETGTSALISRGSAMTDGSSADFRVKVADAAGNSTCSTSHATAGSRLATYQYTSVAAPSGLSYSSPTTIYVYNDANGTLTNNITNNTPTVTGTVTTYAITPDLSTNTGLTFNTSTGVISGKPTLTSAATTYTITATNIGGSTQATVNIRTAPGFEVNDNGDATDASTADNACSTAGAVCTLRAAITQINAMSAGVMRVIKIPAMTITLSSSLPSFSRSLEVIGASRFTSIIDGVDLYRVFHQSAVSNFTMTEMTILNAYSASSGAGVHLGSLATQVQISKSIFKSGRSDHTGSGTRGGVLHIWNFPTGSVTDTVFEENSGNKALIVNGGVKVDRCLFLNNQALAIHVYGPMTISNSTFDGNTVVGGDGAAIVVPNTIGAPATIVNNTFVNNHSSGHSSGIRGGGMANVANNIFLNNTSSWRICDSITSLGGNIIYPTPALADECAEDPADPGDVDPLLGPLANNGGETLSRALSSGSPAINAALSAHCPASDQRAEPRVSATCDVGAFEVQGAAPTLDTTPPASATALAWNVASPTSSTTITASWTPSVAGDLASQKIQFFASSTCGYPKVGDYISLGAAANTSAYTGSDGTTYTYRIMSVDSSGQTQISACSSAITIDTTPPAAPSIVLNSPATSPGNDSTPTFEVALTGGVNFISSDVITLHEGADCSASAVATLTTQTGTSALITRSSAMSQGSTDFRVKVTDTAGNSTCSTSHATAGLQVATYVYDNTAPVVPLIAMSSGYSNPDTQASPSFAITLTGAVNYTDGDVVTLYEGGNNTCNGTARGTSTISGGATSSVDIVTSSALSNFSTVSYFAKVADLAGNSTCSSAGITYTHRPAMPTTLARQSPSATPGNDTTPTIRISGGGVANGATVKLFTDSSCTTEVGSATADATPQADITTSALSAGSYLFYSTVTINSVSSACSTAAVAYVLDTTAPAAPSIVLQSPASSPGNDSTPTFTIALTGGVNFSTTDVITLHEGTDCSAAAVATLTSETGTSALITRGSAMAETTIDFRVKVTDEAGNATCSTSHATPGLQVAQYTYDGTPAGAFTLISAVADDGQVTLSWNASTGAASYTVKYGTSTGVYGTTFTTSGTSPTVITGLTNDTTYYFMVTAVKVGGNTDATSELSAMPSFCADYPAVTSHTDIGSGTLSSPYLLCRPQQIASLGATSADWNKHFKVMTHINLSGYTQVADGTQFIPIGDATTTFKGTFDGNNKEISNLTYSDSTRDYLGLFGVVSGVRAVVKNVKLRNISIAGRDNVGGLVGSMTASKVLNSSVTGSITGSRHNVGGLVGNAYFNSTIGSSWSTVGVTQNVAGTGVGGFVGRVSAGTQIYNSFATGNISAVTNQSSVGGFVGNSTDVRIFASYSTGNVVATSAQAVGGFCGYCRGAFVSNFTTAQTVTGRDNSAGSVGAFGGSFALISASNNYYDSGVTLTNLGTGGATNTTSATGVNVGADPSYFNLATNAPMTAWDFTNSWTTQSGAKPIPNPTFLNESAWGDCSTHLADAPFAGGVGTLENPYLICTAAQFNNIGSNVANFTHKSYKLMADINLAAYPFGTYNMIGSSANPFAGHFDGNGKIIYNFTLNSAGTDYLGLFGSVSKGSIIHLGMQNASVTGKSYVGILAGYLDRTSIFSVFVQDSTVSGTFGVGTLAGWSLARLERSYAANVSVIGRSGASEVGGLTGRINDAGMGSNFIIGTVSATSPGHSVGPIAGVVGSIGGVLTGNYYLSGSTCGSCFNNTGDTVANASDLFVSSNAPLSSWDFITTWQTQTGDYPVFQGNTLPKAPSIVLSSPVTSPSNDSTPTFEVALTGGGNFAATDVITLHEGTNCSGAAVATLTSETGATALITRSSAMSQGTTNFRVKVTSANGLSRCSTAFGTVAQQVATYTYDNTAPVVPLIAMSSGYSNPDTQASPSFAITLTGAVNYADGDVVTLYEGGNNTCNGTARGTSTISGGATSSVDIVTNSALSNFSTVSYFAKVADLAGNSTCSSAGLTYTHRPAMPTTLARQSPSATPGNDTTPTIRISGGGVANGATVKLFTDSSCTTEVGSATADATPQADITTSALSAGSYLFYSTVTINSVSSACSTAAVAYVLDTTAPAAPSIALNDPASSPGVDSTPQFSIGLTGGVNFSTTDVITLHEGSDCSAAAVATLTSETGTSALITRGSAMAETTIDFRVKVTDEAGNATCSTSHASAGLQVATYQYQNIPAPSGLSYSAPTAIYVYNDANGTLTANITNNTPSVTGTVTSYSISPDLNAATGLTFNTSTGVISGKPTITAAATNYTVTATNLGGSTQAIVNIRTAKGFIVNDNGDATDSSTVDNACSTAGGVCTLRAAIVQHNAMSATTRIILVPAMTITVASGFTLSRSTEIIGDSMTTTIVDANNMGGRIITASAQSFTLSKMTFKNSNGGCMYHYTSGTSTINEMKFEDCRGSEGGGIYAHSVTANITNSHFENNDAPTRGAGLYCHFATCNVTGSYFYDNGNNRAIFNLGTLSVSSSLFAFNRDGGLGNHGSATSMVVTNSTFYGNLVNANSAAGGISGSPTGTRTITNSTIVNNTNTYYSPGYAAGVNGNYTITNSIIAFNRRSDGSFDNCGGTITSGGYNISNTSSGDCSFSATGDLPSTDPLLLSLANNGGPTSTLALATGSPAIDAGTATGAPALDQRGQSRPQGSGIDIGAFEGPGAAGTALDTTAPNNATSLGFTEASPSTDTSTTASWTLSNSSDIAYQRILIFGSQNCSTIPNYSDFDLETTFNRTVSDQTYFSYKIVSFDAAGNVNTSACSPNMFVSIPPSNLSYTTNDNIYVYNDANGTLTDNITSNSPTVTGTVTSYSISPNLNTNTGLTFNTSTGVISGKPTATSAATTYTVTASNAGGSTTANLVIRTGPGFLVDSNADDTDSSTADNDCATAGAVCTLRAAVVQINAMSTTVTRLVLIPTMTITLGSVISVNNNIEIIGSNRDSTIIDGAGLYKIFLQGSAMDGKVHLLSYLTLQNGHTTGDGAAIDANSETSTITLRHVRIKNNISTGGTGSAAVETSTGVIDSCIFEGNTNNAGAGAHLYIGAPSTIDNSIFKNGGRALHTNSGNNVTRFSNNTVYNNSHTTGTAGIHLNAGTIQAVFTNNTFANNHTDGTFAGGAIDTAGVGAIFKNNILYNNTGGRAACDATITSEGGNLVYPSEGDCSFSHGSDISSADPLLGVLGDNGGPTETMMIQVGSPAINAGVNTGCPTTDQRGVARPQNGTCDAGSVERE